MGVIEQYWGGVLQRLRAEVDAFGRTVNHVGERGRMNELALAGLLASFVPEGIGVGTGVLFDREDQQSNQTDVVLFDRANQPAIMAQTTEVLFPIEVALACIEVKTTLGSSEVKDCFKKRRGLQALQPLHGGHPPFVVLGYDAGLEPEGYIESLARDLEQLPDLICVLEMGLVGGTDEALGIESTDGWTAGLALAQVDPANDPHEWIPADSTEEHVAVGDRLVSVVTHDGATFAADPGRALLLLAEALARLVAKRGARPEPVLTNYLTEEVRALAPLSHPSKFEPEAEGSPA